MPALHLFQQITRDDFRVPCMAWEVRFKGIQGPQLGSIFSHVPSGMAMGGIQIVQGRAGATGTATTAMAVPLFDHGLKNFKCH